MPIAPKAKFDYYEILAPLGKGGMGEVYRARDTRLNPAGAIKVLPAEVAHDGERLRRYNAEHVSFPDAERKTLCYRRSKRK